MASFRVSLAYSYLNKYLTLVINFVTTIILARLLTPTDPALKIPHMGWNDVAPDCAHSLIAPGEAYFLHSYAFDVDDPAERLAATDHGGPITAAVGRDNIIGVQFHPEKSQSYGLAFLSRFLEWKP